MSKTQGTWIVVFLAVLTAISVHRNYFAKHTRPKYEYRAIEGEKIDLTGLQNAGTEGWDCTITAPEAHRYVILCKRPVP